MLNTFFSIKTVLFVVIIDFISTWMFENDSMAKNDNIIDLALPKNRLSQ